MEPLECPRRRFEDLRVVELAEQFAVRWPVLRNRTAQPRDVHVVLQRDVLVGEFGGSVSSASQYAARSKSFSRLFTRYPPSFWSASRNASRIRESTSTFPSAEQPEPLSLVVLIRV